MKTTILIITVFFAGILIGIVLDETPAPIVKSNIETATPTGSLIGVQTDVNSPSDVISEEQIMVYNDKVVIKLDNPLWSSFSDSNSMDPVIDFGANAIEIVPKNEGQIYPGDIISFIADSRSSIIVHRVKEIGHDNEGWYAITKGDNNFAEDPIKVRFEQVHGIVVGILY